jgi:CRP/FNR family transcriptional regulator, cyclic AMP receptor protein
MPATNSVKSTTKNPTKIAKATARVLLGNALGFRDCDASTLDTLVESATVRTLGKGEELARRGEPFKSLCLIIRGSLETSLSRSDGHRQLVGFLQTGDVFGMVGLADGLGSVHDVRGRDSATTVLLIPSSVIPRLRELDSKLGHAFELQLAFRSRLMYERLFADSSMLLESRLARLILTLAGLYGVERDEGINLAMKISQVDLADWLGVSRQRINTAVQQLKADKLINLSYSTITVVDKNALKTLAGM